MGGGTMGVTTNNPSGPVRDSRGRPAAAGFIWAWLFALSVALLAIRSGICDEKAAAVKEILFEKEMAIGEVEGDENYMFGKTISFCVDSHGNVYVLDSDRKHVRKFGPDGKYLLTFGRQGQGPGEFQSPSEARLSPDGQLYVTEMVNQRIHHYDPEGKFLGDTNLPDEITDIWWAPNGNRLGVVFKHPMYVGQGDVEYDYTIFSTDFKPILELYGDVIDLQIARGVPPARWRAQIANYFLARPSPMAVMSEDGFIFFGLSNAYAIQVYSQDAKKLRTISRDIAPAEYAKEDIEFVLRTYDETLYAEQSEAERKEIRALIRFPKYKPFFRSLIPMEGGRLAVLADSRSMDACVLDLFDAEGAFLGRVQAAVPWVNLLFKAGKAYCVRTDENGYKSVERYAYKLR
jgi:hypothetical protein